MDEVEGKLWGKFGELLAQIDYKRDWITQDEAGYGTRQTYEK